MNGRVGALAVLLVAACTALPPPLLPAPVLPGLSPALGPDEVDPCPEERGIPGDYLDPCAPPLETDPWIYGPGGFIHVGGLAHEPLFILGIEPAPTPERECPDPARAAEPRRAAPAASSSPPRPARCVRER